ncbi:MAG TPA: response regulator [Pirellulales bacterium]|jgi:CheY-like chemotaxis protein|nr:response regulator [Pirellulales bacterium]
MTTPTHDDVGRALAETEPLRVLIVDDNADEADSLATLLAFRGHEVQRAYSANAALEIAEGFRPEVFLLDLGLPRMSGYELAGQLRKEFSDAVLIATTGHVDEAYRLQARDAGFEHYFTKPVSIIKLHQLLESVAIQRAARRFQ